MKGERLSQRSAYFIISMAALCAWAVIIRGALSWLFH